MVESNTGQLSDRAQHLLRALIERFIREGEPVGSRTLAREAGMELSPATVRNVMADLEEMGFVASPHTSAGRVPTVQGYRFFVNTLLTIQPLDGPQIQQLRERLGIAGDMERKDLVEIASGLVSRLTNLAGVVTLPRRKHAALRRVDFLPLSSDRVLVILVVDETEVQNRIIHTGRVYSPSQLENAANYLNRHFGGKNLASIRRTLFEEMREARRDMDAMMAATLEVAEKAFSESDETQEDFVLAGETNLMDVRELCDVDKLRELFEAFSQKREILHLLDQCINARGVQIFIGEESGFHVLDEYSVVTAPYSVDGRVLGAVGVIGPTRMAYHRVIPIVDTTARLLGAALNPGN
jgi:heat-inducible transcriptional repressor